MVFSGSDTQTQLNTGNANVASENTSTANTLPLKFTLEVHNKLAEGVLWDEQQQRIFWTDIQSSQLFEYCIHTREMQVRHMPERLTCFGLTTQPDVLVCGLESGFAYYALSSKTVTWITKVETDNPGTRLNDGRVDREGNFWAGTMVENPQTRTDNGYLYRLSAGATSDQHSMQRYLSGLQISNGLCWSPNGEAMYHADSPTHTIRRYQIQPASQPNQPPTLSHARTFATTANDHFPDGATVDKHGNLWSAQWGSSKVVCYAPTGKIILTVGLPVSQVSCVAIGGPKLDWLIVTTASELSAEQKKQEPQAGNIFVFQLPESIGLIEPRYKAVPL